MAQSRPRRSLETVSSWVFIAVLVVAIFAFLPSSDLSLATTKTFLIASGALITLALYILARLSRGNIIFPPLLLVGAFWLPTVAYALSSAFSGVPFGTALWGRALESDTLGFMLVAAIFGTLAAFILRRPEQYRTFLHAGAWVFIAVAVLQAIILIAGQFSPVVSPTFSLLGSFQDLSFFLGLGVIGTLITLRFLELSRRAHWALLAGGVVALFLLAVANTSAVWVLLALVSLGLFVEAVMRRGPKTADTDFDDIESVGEAPLESEDTNRSLVLPLLVLAVSLFFIIGGTLGGALANAFHVNVLSVSPSWQSTLSTARSAYVSAPVFGTGPGTFGVEWLKHRDTSLNTSIFWNIDFSSGVGFIPTSFVTVGLLGVLAWIVFIVAFVVFGLRAIIMRAPKDSFVYYVAVLSFVSALYLFVVATVGLPNVVILTLAFVFAGLFASTMRFADKGRQWGIIFSRSPRIGFVIVFSLTILLLTSVVAAYALVEHAVAATQLASANAAFSAGDLDAADRLVQSSVSFVPSPDAYQAGASIASARLSQIVASSTMPTAAAQAAFQGALSDGVSAALTATSLAPSDYQNWIVLGNLYAQAVPLGATGAYENAKTSYEKAQELNPTNPQISYILAQLDIANKDTKAAEENLKAAIALKQDYTAAIFLLSQLEVQDGNIEDALSSALAAAYFTPNNPDILFQVGILYAAQNDFANAAAALETAVGVNPQFANARYFLSAVYAKQNAMDKALVQMQAIADMSEDNATAVASQLAALTAGKNPFPANLLTLSSTPVGQ